MDTTEPSDPIIIELKAKCEALLEEAKRFPIGSQEWIEKLDQVCLVTQELKEYESIQLMPSQPTK